MDVSLRLGGSLLQVFAETSRELRVERDVGINAAELVMLTDVFMNVIIREISASQYLR